MKKIIEIAKNSYTEKDYNYHILPVVKNALLLAKKLNADLEVVEIAAYLHDIGRAIKKKFNNSTRQSDRLLGYEVTSIVDTGEKESYSKSRGRQSRNKKASSSKIGITYINYFD